MSIRSSHGTVCAFLLRSTLSTPDVPALRRSTRANSAWQIVLTIGRPKTQPPSRGAQIRLGIGCQQNSISRSTLSPNSESHRGDGSFDAPVQFEPIPPPDRVGRHDGKQYRWQVDLQTREENSDSMATPTRAGTLLSNRQFDILLSFYCQNNIIGAAGGRTQAMLPFS